MSISPSEFLKWLSVFGVTMGGGGGGGGTVTSVGSGLGLTGGPITGAGTLSLALAFPGVVQISPASFDSGTNASITTFLRGDGTWATPANSGGTVTSVGSGLGLTGGPITGAGTLSLGLAFPPTVQISPASFDSGTNASITTFLRGDGTWVMPPSSSGTVTSVGSGLGLTGGPITGAGTLSLDLAFPPTVQISPASFDSGISAGITTFLRGDGTWVTPPSSGGTVVPANIQSGQYVYAYDQSIAANQIIANYTPAIVALTDGQILSVKVNFTNTLTAPTFDVDSLGAIPIRYIDGSNILPADITGGGIYDFQYNLAGAYYAILNPNSSFKPQVIPSQIQSNSFVYGVDTGSSTAYAVNLSPAPTAIPDGMSLFIKVVNTNTTTTPTLNVNSLGTITIANTNNTPLKLGDMIANGEYFLKRNATFGIWGLMNPSSSYSGYLPLTGGTMSGDINLGGNDLRNVTSIQDTGGLNILTFTPAASAVNYLGVLNGATSNPPELRTFGSDASVPFNIRTKNGVLALSDYTNTIPGEIRYYNIAGNHYTGLRALSSAANNITFNLPNADANGFMISDGAGNLSLKGTYTDLSGIVGFNGWSLLTNNIVNALQIGKIVFIVYRIVGTSNSSAFQITNFPFSFAPNIDVFTTYNNGGTQGEGHINANGTTLTFYNAPTSAVWATSGAKNATGSIVLQIA